MKKALLVLLCVCLVLGSVQAFALELPQAVAQAFQGEAWAEWTPVAVDKATKKGMPGIHAAVIMQREGRNVLCLLDKVGSGYRIASQSARAVYQGDVLPTLAFDDDVSMGILILEYAKGRDGSKETYKWDRIDEIPYWIIASITIAEPGRNGITLYTGLSFYRAYVAMAEYTNEHIQDQRAYDRAERFYGVLQRMPENFGLDAYPRTLYTAGFTIGPLPKLSAGEQQDPLPAPQPVKLKGPVSAYASPSEGYSPVIQEDVKPADAVSALAVEGVWALITFKGADGAALYGYVPYAAIEDASALPETEFVYLRAEWKDLTQTEIRVAPDDSARVITSMPTNVPCYYLGTVGSEWSYIEVLADQNYRGFVRSDTLNIFYDLDISTDDVMASLTPNGRITRDVEIIDDPYRRDTWTKLSTLVEGDSVVFIDNLYDEWACVQVYEGDKLVRGFIPYDAVESMNEWALEGNG